MRWAQLGAVALILSGCGEQLATPTAPPWAANVVSATPSRYLVLTDERNAAAVATAITGLGATLDHFHPKIGVIAVSSDDGGFASVAGTLKGVAAVVPDPGLQNWAEQSAVSSAIVGDVPPDEPLVSLQWALRPINVTQAWTLGARGRGARVAILDSGIDHDHPDLAANVNVSLSRSFVPGAPVFVPPGNELHHGTLMAGIVASRDNGIGVIGVAPEAEIVAIRVLGPSGFFFSDVIAGLMYAADIEADVVNMSFGTNFPRSGIFDAAGNQLASAVEVQELMNALNRATHYAHQRGVTLIAAAGNARIDRDHDANRIVAPADLDFVESISATAPFGFAANPDADPDPPASYVNFGTSRIDFAAPGGDFQTGITTPCTVGPITFFCVVFDGVITSANGGIYRWCGGTSCAAAHVTAIAALLIGAHGGQLDPQEVGNLLRLSADDLGKPGRDPYYGHGRVNAGRAVAMLRGLR
jgi:lantibiotic leader peptide-processing serine protease